MNASRRTIEKAQWARVVRAELRRLRELPRWLRLACALLIVVATGIVVSAGPNWLSYLGGLVAAAFVSLLVVQYGPAIVEGIANDAPIQALIGADAVVHSDGWSVVTPTVLAARDRPAFAYRPTVEEVRSWFIRRGAYDADTSHLRLALVGRSREPVVITGMNARVLARDPIPDGSLITYPWAGAAALLAMEFDLDQEDAQALSGGKPYFAEYSLTLAEREAQEIRIAARARTAALRWELEISYSWRGNRHVLRLDNDGEPFRTSPTPDVSDRHVWQWWEADPTLAPEATAAQDGA